MSEKEFDEFIKYICLSIQEWKEHPKEGSERYKNYLKKFQKIWNWFIDVINRIEESDDTIREIEKDFIDLIKYEGDLYRYHIEYDVSDSKYGIRETDYLISWTKSNSPSAFYWTYEGREYLRIHAQTNHKYFGIDLVGFSEFIQKYTYPNYTLGSPAIIKEQEVVFPLNMRLVKKLEIVTR